MIAGDRPEEERRPDWPAGLWRRLLREAVTDPEELLKLVGLASPALPEGPGASRAATREFPLRVPRGFVRRMRRGDPRDPLLLQVLPTDVELESAVGYGPDPLGEVALGGPRGLLHKYHGRALLVVVGACAIHCRYCFRRHYPYGERQLGRRHEEALAALRRDLSLREVILSGGDPLTVGDDELARLVQELERVPHLRRLRLHTRLPVVLPERIDDALLSWLGGGRLRRVVVLHVNHGNEIDDDVERACRALTAAGIQLLNQTVLLRRVNDDVETLCRLSERLFEVGVLPYYLHLLDPVAGAAHFEVDERRARAIVAQVAARLPGYLVPRLVREVPGAPAKVPLPLDLRGE